MAQQINLFDPELKRKRDWLSLTNVVLAGLLLAVGVGAAGQVARHEIPGLSAQVDSNEMTLKTMREQIAALGQQVTGRKPDARLAQEIEAMRLVLSSRGEVVNLLKQRMGADAVSYAEYMRGFARQTMPGLWLVGFSVDSATNGMEIEGRLVDPALLPEYIQRLNREPAFKGRAFAALRLIERKSEPAGTPTAGETPPTRKPAYHEFALIPQIEDKSTAPKPGKLPSQAYYDMAVSHGKDEG